MPKVALVNPRLYIGSVRAGVQTTIVLASVAFVSGCVNQETPHVPTYAWCGTTVYRGGEVAPFVYQLDTTRDIAGGSIPPAEVIVQISANPGCDHGADLTFIPSGSAQVTVAANARDGKIVAALITVPGTRTTIRARLPDGTVVTTRVNINASPPEPSLG